MCLGAMERPVTISRLPVRSQKDSAKNTSAISSGKVQASYSQRRNSRVTWGCILNRIFCDEMDKICEPITQFSRKTFNIITGKSFIDQISPNISDFINEEMIQEAAMKTKGSAGPLEIDKKLHQRILCSNISSQGNILREEIISFYHPVLHESYTFCRLIPLDKDPEVRPFGVGEVSKQIISKTVASFFKKEIKEAAGHSKVYAWYRGKAEATIHAMSDLSGEEETGGVLLIDATSAFNQVNWAIAIPSLQITCNKIAM